MESRKCETCGARWLDGCLYWATGKPGSELDLASLVCNRLDSEKPCANPLRGTEGGQTWESRMRDVDKALERGGL